jgi:hypothetical protein
VGGHGELVVVCPSDVRRSPFEPSAVVARGFEPAIGPAQERVCDCAKRINEPDYLDLVFTAHPESGTVEVVAKPEQDAERSTVERDFDACVGTIAARFARFATNMCPNGEPATLIFPVRLERDR